MPRVATESPVMPRQTPQNRTLTGDPPCSGPGGPGAATGLGGSGFGDDLIPAIPRLTDHWGPLEGWTRERELLACYLTFDEQVGLHSVVEAHQRPIKDVPELDMVPKQWLHATVQGIAFADGLQQDSIDDLAQVLGHSLGHLPPVHVATAEPVISGEGAYLRLGPVQALAEVRDLIRDAATEVLGIEQPYALPGQDDSFDPHVSFAYANDELPAELIWQRLADVGHDPVDLEITAISLVMLKRDDRDRRWHWSDARQLELGA